MVWPLNATLVNGRYKTGEALGNESLSAAGAEGFNEERLNSTDAKTLRTVSLVAVHVLSRKPTCQRRERHN